MPVQTQLGVKQEDTYGTPKTVDSFYPLIGETFVPNTLKQESTSRRSNALFQAKTANLVIPAGVKGDLVLPAYNRGLGKFLKWMLGAVSTAGPADTTAYTHTFTCAALEGLGFTAQTNRPFHSTNSPQPFTVSGGKVMSWNISVAPNGEMTITLTVDGHVYSFSTSLATASYPSDYELLSWADTASGLTVAGTPVPCTAWSLSGSNGLKDSDPHIGAAHVEPIRNAFRDIDFSFTADFTDLSLANLANAVTNAGQYPGSPGMVFKLGAPSLITGAATTKPSLTITTSAPRFDDDPINNADMEPTMQTVTGKIRDDLVNSPISIAYVTADSTP